jgi:glycine/D-amino acid oxidase-like deaminating enzyme
MRYVVLGGGIAGVCCAEELCKLCYDDEVVLVSSHKTLKVSGEAFATDCCQPAVISLAHLCRAWAMW